MPHIIHDLVSELPPTSATEKDPFRETLFVPRHNLTMRLRKMLRLTQLENEVQMLRIWLYVLGISHLALIIVLILCLR